MIITSITTSIYLTIGSVFDIKTRRIPNIFIYSFSTLILVITLLSTNLPFNEHLYGLIPGAILLLISKLTKEAIGIGDCLVIALLGFVYGISLHIELLLIVFGLLLITSIMLVVLKKAGRKTSLPMIPFILASFLIFMAIHIGDIV